MAENEVIRESDLIQLDGTINKLIEQLTSLEGVYSEAMSTIKAQAKTTKESMQTVSAATEQGKKAIDEAAVAAARLNAAYVNLSIASSDVGKELVAVRTETARLNKETKDHYIAISSQLGSYDRLKAELAEAVSLYKSLSAAERNEASMGGALLTQITNLANQVQALDNCLKPHIEQLTRVAKAEQELAFWQSEEGKRLIELRQQINAAKNARTSATAETKGMASAEEQIASALSDENVALKQQQYELKQANKEAELRAKINASAENSYNRLAAQYALVKLRLDAMSQGTGRASDEFVVLQKDAEELYKQMIKLQEATGKHALKVGDYKTAWNGLGMSVNQIVRELPSAAVSANTFFLAISNNIPILVDEINKLRAQNKILQREGRATTNVLGGIAKALFSWNTVITLVVTAFSMWGKEILDFAFNADKAARQVTTTSKALKDMADEVGKSNANYGKHMVSLSQLRKEYKELRTEGEKNQWIKDNQSVFRELDISVTNVNDAENVFISNTAAVQTAFKLRALSAAGEKLATDKYTEALEKRVKIEAKQAKLAEEVSKYGEQRVQLGAGGDIGLKGEKQRSANRQAQLRAGIKQLEEEAAAADADAEAYLSLAGAEAEKAREELKAAGIEEYHARNRERRGKEGLSLTEQIARMKLDVEKRYQEAAAKIEEEGYERSRANLQVAGNKTILELEAIKAKNERWLEDSENKYKPLSDAQRQAILDANVQIDEAIEDERKALQNALIKLDLQYAAKRAHVEAEATELKLAAIKKGSKEELDLRLKLISDNEKAAIAENALKIEEERQAEDDIRAKFAKQRIDLTNEWQLDELNSVKKSLQDRIEAVRKGSKEELAIRLTMLEVEKNIALIEDSLLPDSLKRGPDSIAAEYTRLANLLKGQNALANFSEQQAYEKAQFESTKRSTYEINRFKLQQEQAFIEEQIRLVEAGQLEASDTTVAIWKETLKKIGMELRELEGDISPTGLLSKLGFTDDQISALKNAISQVVNSLKEIFEAEEELRQQAVDAAQERMDLAKEAYDAEIEARKNGYANYVETAKLELIEAEKNLKKKQKMLEDAQKRSRQLDSLTQASSLITATAELWKAFAGAGALGIVAAGTATAAMWTAFAAAKIKASQVTSQAYGEGGYEVLEGGSHASGHDIDLGVNNRKKRRMRVEGGEALAIIKKRSTRKYASVLPDVIKSFNDGVFEQKYMNAFNATIEPRIVSQQATVDLSNVEKSLDDIKKQNESQYSVLPDGTIVTINKNVKRIIHK